MISFFEQCTREGDGAYVQSQGSPSNFCNKGTDMTRHQGYTKRDTVMQTCIENMEDDKQANICLLQFKRNELHQQSLNISKISKLDEPLTYYHCDHICDILAIYDDKNWNEFIQEMNEEFPMTDDELLQMEQW